LSSDYPIDLQPKKKVMTENRHLCIGSTKMTVIQVRGYFLGGGGAGGRGATEGLVGVFLIIPPVLLGGGL